MLTTVAVITGGASLILLYLWLKMFRAANFWLDQHDEQKLRADNADAENKRLATELAFTKPPTA